jgi:acyl-CoA synthetase (AMP-forming)/AMP-acid ligase II
MEIGHTPTYVDSSMSQETVVSLTGTGTLGAVLRERADARPDAPFIIFGDQSWSFCRLETESTSLAAALGGLGVESGDRIAVDLPNWPEFAITLFAAAKLGATVVPLNPELASRDVQFMLRNSEATVVVAAEQYRGRDYLQLFETLLVGLPDLQYVVTVGEEDLWYDDRIFQFEDLVSAGRGRELRDADVDPLESAAAILYTAGTTGKAKGVMLSHANLMETAAATAAVIGLRPDDVTLCAVPLFNIFGANTLLGALATGSTVVLQERFEPVEALALIEAHRATVLHGVPTMFVLALREAAGHELSSLRTGILAGAPVAASLAARVRDELVPQVEIGYGLTETSPTVSLTSSKDPPEKRSTTVGRPLPGVSVKILDDEGRELPPGREGSLVVKGFNVMLGYFRQPGETAAALTADGYLRTGDLGVMDEDGYLRIVGRAGDDIIRGGYSIHPREVEDHLRSHPAVMEAVVVGTPNEVLGELICACIQPVEGAIITAEELREYCVSALAGYKVPDLVRFFEVFPMTPSGRPRRAEVAEMVRAEPSGSEGRAT